MANLSFFWTEEYMFTWRNHRWPCLFVSANAASCVVLWPLWVNTYYGPHVRRLWGMKSCQSNPATDTQSPLQAPMFYQRWVLDSHSARYLLAKTNWTILEGPKKLAKLVAVTFQIFQGVPEALPEFLSPSRRMATIETEEFLEEVADFLLALPR